MFSMNVMTFMEKTLFDTTNLLKELKSYQNLKLVGGQTSLDINQ